MAIKSVRIWRNAERTETRIYIHTTDNREGCKYLSGNPWHPKGELEGQLTKAEYAEARALAIWDGKWHSVSEPQVAARRGGFVEDTREDIEAMRNHVDLSPSGEYHMEETGRC